jgi:hypothetical protein
MKARWVTALLLTAALSTGCGTKGELVLPEPAPAPAPTALPPPVVDPPAEPSRS